MLDCCPLPALDSRPARFSPRCFLSYLKWHSLRSCTRCAWIRTRCEWQCTKSCDIFAHEVVLSITACFADDAAFMHASVFVVGHSYAMSCVCQFSLGSMLSACAVHFARHVVTRTLVFGATDSSYKIKPNKFKVRGSNTMIIAYIDLEMCFKAQTTQGLEPSPVRTSGNCPQPLSSSSAPGGQAATPYSILS